jgi:hypothetical protein
LLFECIFVRCLVRIIKVNYVKRRFDHGKEEKEKTSGRKRRS